MLFLGDVDNQIEASTDQDLLHNSENGGSENSQQNSDFEELYVDEQSNINAITYENDVIRDTLTLSHHFRCAIAIRSALSQLQTL